MNNVVKVRIFGKDYILNTEETETYALKLAALLNQKLEKTVKGASNMSKLDAAALVALDSVDEAYKSSANLENIRTQIKKYADEAAKSKEAVAELQIENKELREKIAQLEKEIAVRKALTPKKVK
ncbi:MAG: cell division protein ZapA [Oscillospiraceae bacterium]|nr:cell division protein ZapA [Oscillospiraceae bacterium]